MYVYNRGSKGIVINMGNHDGQKYDKYVDKQWDLIDF